MKYLAYYLALLGSSKAATCTFEMQGHEALDMDCSDPVESATSATFTYEIGKCFQESENTWMYIPYCDPAIGMAMYAYNDAACTVPEDLLSPDLGCPKNGCCHLSGTILFGLAASYKINILEQTGSRYGLSFVEAIFEVFNSLK